MKKTIVHDCETMLIKNDLGFMPIKFIKKPQKNVVIMARYCMLFKIQVGLLEKTKRLTSIPNKHHKHDWIICHADSDSR